MEYSPSRTQSSDEREIEGKEKTGNRRQDDQRTTMPTTVTSADGVIRASIDFGVALSRGGTKKGAEGPLLAMAR
jgi:hypothetical protein